MKFVHAADLHLDSPLLGLVAYEGAPVDEVRGATRRALSNLVSACIAERAELLLISGDLYDGDWRDYSTGLFFIRQMSRLSDEGIRVVWIRGNHDAQSQLTRHLSLPPNVRELSVTEAETVLFEDLGIAVHGMGYASRDVTENLARAYPARVPGLLNVGLLHTALDGRALHAPYAPCSVDQLKARGYDYWALGHVHQREIVSEEPWIVFPGNLQGRHIRETGSKGASVVTFDGSGVRTVDHVPLDVVRWVPLVLDVSSARTFDDVLGRIDQGIGDVHRHLEGRTLAVRVELVGRTAAAAAIERQRARFEAEVRASSLLRGRTFVEAVRLDLRPEGNPEDLFTREDALGDLFRSVRARREDLDQVGSAFRARLLEGLDAMPVDLLDELLGRPGDTDFSQLRRLLEESEMLLSGRLLGEDERT